MGQQTILTAASASKGVRHRTRTIYIIVLWIELHYTQQQKHTNKTRCKPTNGDIDAMTIIATRNWFEQQTRERHPTGVKRSRWMNKPTRPTMTGWLYGWNGCAKRRRWVGRLFKLRYIELNCEASVLCVCIWVIVSICVPYLSELSHPSMCNTSIAPNPIMHLRVAGLASGYGNHVFDFDIALGQR